MMCLRPGADADTPFRICSTSIQTLINSTPSQAPLLETVFHGGVAKWQCTSLQNWVSWFDSNIRLQTPAGRAGPVRKLSMMHHTHCLLALSAALFASIASPA